MLEVTVRSAFLPPIQVPPPAGQGGTSSTGGGGIADTVGSVLKPQVFVGGLPVAAPWGEPGDWRLGFAALVGLAGLGAFVIVRGLLPR